MKVGRAYKHVREFDSLVVAAHCKRSDLFTATGRDDIENGRFIGRVEYAMLKTYTLMSQAISFTICAPDWANLPGSCAFPAMEVPAGTRCFLPTKKEDLKSEEQFV